MTPMEIARKIVDEHFWTDIYGRVDWRDDKSINTLSATIAEALQRESNAQLDRDRAVIQAAKKAARIHFNAWSSIDGRMCVLLEKIKRQRKRLVVEFKCNESLAKDLRNYREAIEWMGRMATISGEGRAIYEALRRAIANPAERSNA